MSLSRASSPQLGASAAAASSSSSSSPRRPATPRLSVDTKRSRSRSPAKKSYGDLDARTVTWEAAAAQSSTVKGYKPAVVQSSRQGLFMRHFRSLSASLPRFHRPVSDKYTSREKAGRGRLLPATLDEWRTAAFVASRMAYRWRKLLTVVLGLVLLTVLFNVTPARHAYKRTSFLGGGSKFLIILAANEGGGVMEWKGPREWAIERDSVRNKKRYARRHGYELEIVDMTTKRRYAHEWRESWQKVDILRRCLYDYPDVEWFWWLDLNTYIMEPSVSLQSQIFNQLQKNTYRDINHWNPLNISHPPTDAFLDAATLSAVGDGLASSINMIIPQDCSGFNLGSFFVRRSKWTERLLDIWWDPVHYEQKHMQWEHKEQDALEYLYTNQPWVRPHVAFIEQRKMCSFPIGACGDERNPRWHYDERDRDFVVSMAGCQWGRDCWGEMYGFRELSYWLNKGYWESFVDWCRAKIRDWRGIKQKSIIAIEPGTGKKKIY